jgi:hypothetical protein
MRKKKREWWHVVGPVTGNSYAHFRTKREATKDARRRERAEYILRGTYLVVEGWVA